MDKKQLGTVIDHIYENDTALGFCGHDIPVEALERIVLLVAAAIVSFQNEEHLGLLEPDQDEKKLRDSP